MSSDVAWAAGFYDGEGCAWVQESKGKLYARLSVAQKSVKTLARWAESLGLMAPIHSQGKNNGVHFICVSKTADIQMVMDQMWPWLTDEKKDQFERVVARVEERMAGRPRRRTKPLYVPHNRQ